MSLLESDLADALRRSMSDVVVPPGLLAGVRARRVRARRRRVASATSGGVGAVAVVAGAVVLAGSVGAPASGGAARLASSPSVVGAAPTVAVTPAALDPHGPPTLHLPSIHVTVVFDANPPAHPADFAPEGDLTQLELGRPCGAAGTRILGHRTTYGKPFEHLDQIARGAVATVSGGGLACSYTAVSKVVVAPEHEPALQPGTLQLVTFTPKYSAVQRLVVTFRLTCVTSPGHPWLVHP